MLELLKINVMILVNKANDLVPYLDYNADDDLSKFLSKAESVTVVDTV